MSEMTVLKRKLKEAEEAGDEERSRSQAQRIQLLDEVSCRLRLVSVYALDATRAAP